MDRVRMIGMCALLSMSCSSPQEDVMAPVGSGGVTGTTPGVIPNPGGMVPGGAAGTVAPPPFTGGVAGVTGAAGSAVVTPPGTGGAGGTGTVGNCMDCPIPPECQGFSFEGIRYSPGGMDLPNKCEPFHPTTNNPYAVRCIDVWPNYETGFPGDEYCILPPPPELGMQVGLHPHGDVDTYWEQTWAGDYSVYQNPPEPWVVEVGGELTQNYRGHSTNMEPVNYYRTYFRMRTGSHHNIITMHEGMEPDHWIDGVGDALPGLFDSSSGAIQGVLGGQQRPDDSTPVSFERPAEDAGLYLTFPAQVGIIYNMHHFNTTDQPILREGWSNIWFETAENSTVRASWYMGLAPEQLLTLSVSAGQTRDFHYYWNVATDLRLIRVFGHRHFWTPNFSTWIQRAGGETELIYQSYDWADMPTYRYDSVAQNPALNPDARTDGAVSGVINLKAGDQLHFNCHVTFTDAHAATDMAAPSASSIGGLRFANQAYHGEMCIQFGNVSGGSLGLPGSGAGAVPDFATVVKGVN
jgi:hypothetical protein